MQPVEYTPDDFASLRVAARSLRVPSLGHRPFVDHYYSGNPWSKLHLIRAESGSVVGTIGIDRMRFAGGDAYLTLAFATNFHAARPGVGGLLYLHWLKTCPLGLVFGGSPDTHKILRRQRWTYFPGVKTYVLNRRYPIRPEDALWKRWAKRILAGLPKTGIDSRLRRIPRAVRRGIDVREEDHVSADMLPRTSPFSFRFAPTTDYVNWRYRTGLPFVRYRVFRLCEQGRTFGYVVLHDSPEKVVVAHCDGDDPTALAYGVLLSLAEATREAAAREVLLACSHPAMARVYLQFGFRASGGERPLAVGSCGGRVELPADTSSWLVNAAWGDNDLRAPFPDQSASEDPLTAPSRLGHDARA